MEVKHIQTPSKVFIYNNNILTPFLSVITKGIFCFTVDLKMFMLSLQCVRRLCEEKDQAQALNGLRYFLTILALVIKTAYGLRKGSTLEVLVILSSLITTFFNTYWDIVVDWGLLRRKSKNKFLRDKLILHHKSVYFIAMVISIIHSHSNFHMTIKMFQFILT